MYININNRIILYRIIPVRIKNTVKSKKDRSHSKTLNSILLLYRFESSPSNDSDIFCAQSRQRYTMEKEFIIIKILTKN